jgi:two-component system, cell cycle response regulator
MESVGARFDDLEGGVSNKMAQAIPIPERSRAQTQIAPRRVLVVDDSKFVRTTFNRILSATFAVTECADGLAAWEALQNDPAIVMVVSDIDMPRLDGYGLLERIRTSADARIKALPVLVFSGSQSENAKKRARDLGANDFVSKEADAPELLSRIDNLLRLVKASHDLDVSKEVSEQNAAHDPLTGALTRNYLVEESRKRYAHVRRHGGEISVVAFRVDSYAEVAKNVGKDVADELLKGIVKLVSGTLRTDDSIGLVAEATFVIISTGTPGSQVINFARRLYQQLHAARVNYREQPLKIVCSFGITAAGDASNSVEELLQLAVQRLKKAMTATGERIVGRDEVIVQKPAAPALPADVERALAVLAQADPEKLGEATNEILRRLLPLLKVAFRRLRIELPVEKIAALLDRR